MQQSEDFRRLDDPAFLTERARLRELLEHKPEGSAGRAPLADLYDAMMEEFNRRARAEWAKPA